MLQLIMYWRSSIKESIRGVIMRVEKDFSKGGVLSRKRFFDEKGNLIKERHYTAAPSGGTFSVLCYLSGCPYKLNEYHANGNIIASTLLYREYQYNGKL